MKQNQQVVEKKDKIVKTNEKGTYRVQSETDVNRYYIVKFMDGIPLWCSCKNWEFKSQRNPNHICKHQKSVIESETIVVKNLSYLGDEYSY
jgi:hypothetical protein